MSSQKLNQKSCFHLWKKKKQTKAALEVRVGCICWEKTWAKNLHSTSVYTGAEYFTQLIKGKPKKVGAPLYESLSPAGIQCHQLQQCHENDHH